MVDTNLMLLGISFILFFGFFAEFIFRKFNIPDVLFLLALGFIFGPFGLNYIQPGKIAPFASVFTTFALLFLIYDGAFNIDLASFAKGVGKSLGITLFNYVISVAVVTAILIFTGLGFLTSLLTAVILGGICSAFVIPLIKQMKIQGETYFILAFEAAITDVLCIVFSLALIEIIRLNSFNMQFVAEKIISIFAVASFIGVLAGLLWIIIIKKILREYKSYMITIAYVILVYVVTEFLKGNGAIAALFFGLVLRNSKQITSILDGIIREKKSDNAGIVVTSHTEQLFYSQVSFFLKTFFFVYIGILLDISDIRMILIGLLIAIALMISRKTSALVTRSLGFLERKVVSSIFARGLAAATIAQIAVFNNVPGASVISNITYSVISFTIILSSIQVFLMKRVIPSKHTASEPSVTES